MGGGDRATQHREILREHIDLTAIDGAPAGDHPVACRFVVLHAEIGTAMADEHVELFKAVLVQQQFDAFARGQFAAGVLCVDAFLSAAKARVFAAPFEFGKDILHGKCPLISLGPMFRTYFEPGSLSATLTRSQHQPKANIANLQMQCIPRVQSSKFANQLWKSTLGAAPMGDAMWLRRPRPARPLANGCRHLAKLYHTGSFVGL